MPGSIPMDAGCLRVRAPCPKRLVREVERTTVLGGSVEEATGGAVLSRAGQVISTFPLSRSTLTGSGVGGIWRVPERPR